MIEVLKTLKCRVKLYIDKLFQLMLNPGILLLMLKRWNGRQHVEFEPNFYREEVVNLEHVTKVKEMVRQLPQQSPGGGLWPALA